MARILILGGYGLTGSYLARLLLRHSTANILIAGRNLQKAESFANALGESFGSCRVRDIRVDVEDLNSIRSALPSVDLVLAATSFGCHCSAIAKVALENGVDYLDVLYSPSKLAVLCKIEKRGLCFVTEAGFHPGLPLVLTRQIAQRFDSLERAIIGSVIQMKIERGMAMPESIYDLVAAFRQKPLIFRAGRWFTPWIAWLWPYRRINFSAPFGTRNCAPFFLPELEEIPIEFPSVTETGFYIAGFNWFVDWVLSPLVLIAVFLAPNAATRPMGKLLFWGARNFSTPPFGTELVVDAVGRRGQNSVRERLIVSHEDAYAFTAVPVVAFLKQYLDGSARKPGLWMMGRLADPQRLVKDMQDMGIAVRRPA
jgi:saccharopine dehydrogenase (NAD+, L-lysine-forming)